MSKMFPKLTQNTVRLEIGDGQSVNVPMLGIGQLDELHGITEELRQADSEEKFIVCKKRMIALASTVLPAELAERLPRFRVDKLADLLGYLAFGDEDDDDQPKKNG